MMPPPSFICPLCGAESFNQGDVANHYCGQCHVFVRDLVALEALPGDAGMRFFATITKPNGDGLYCETSNRLALLEWLRLNATPADALTVQTEASGAAARAMVTALRLGARSLIRRAEVF